MYNEVKTSFRKHLDFIIIDILAMEASFFIACFLRYGSWRLMGQSEYRTVILVLVFSNLITHYIFNSMQDVLKRPFQIEIYATFKQSILTWAILLFFTFITKTSIDYSRNVFLIFPIIYFFLSLLTRSIYKAVVKKHFVNVKAKEYVVITTSERLDEIKKRHDSIVNDFNIKKYFCIDELNDNMQDIYKYIMRNHVDEVLICINGKNDIKKILLEKLNDMGIITHIEIDYIDAIIGANNKEFVESICDYTVLTCTVSTVNTLQLFVKRFFDIVLSIIGLVFVAIFTVIIGPIIKAKSKGPIFFKQKRVGKNGKTFDMYKFRSMHVGADDEKKYLLKNNNQDSDLMFKMQDDPRVIPGIGDFIRRTSIDEFPQFLNVLKGEMSVVGTRPPTLDEWEKYELHHRARLSIKPGITGLWQVSGRSEIKDFEKVVKLDREYIKNFSIALDIAIILKTFKAVFLRVGAK